MRPYSPIPRFVSGSDHGSLIHRLLRDDVHPEVQRIDLITTTQLRVSVIDSGHLPREQIAEGDTCIHVLWQTDEPGAEIEIEGERLSIAPGDTAWIPAGDSWQLSADQLAVLMAIRSNSLAVPIEPTHGDERFEGYNRETVAPGPRGARLSRWKLTGPLDLTVADNDLILVSLYADVAVRFDGGISMLRQGEASVIRPGMGQITLVPNGLSYVSVVQLSR